MYYRDNLLSGLIKGLSGNIKKETMFPSGGFIQDLHPFMSGKKLSLHLSFLVCQFLFLTFLYQFSKVNQEYVFVDLVSDIHAIDLTFSFNLFVF